MPIWSVYSGYSPDFTLALPFKQLILKREDGTVLKTNHPPRGLKGVEMGHIKEKDLGNGSKRLWQWDFMIHVIMLSVASSWRRHGASTLGT